MTQGFFITGTDTGVGKTAISLALMATLQKAGYTVNAFKPIACGVNAASQNPINDDVRRLQQQSSELLPTHIICPYHFKDPIAPHIAAQEVGVEINLEVISTAYKQIAANSDYVIVEGVGGLCVPINAHQTTVDLAKCLGVPVILVVGIRLGCLNHTLLSEYMLRTMDLSCIGWVANTIDPTMQHVAENIESLQNRLEFSLIFALPYMKQDKRDQELNSVAIKYFSQWSELLLTRT